MVADAVVHRGKRNPGGTRLTGSPSGSDHLFRILVQGVVDYALFLLDTEGRITTWNAGAERIKGYAPEEVIGSHFSRFYTPEDRAAGLPARALRTAAECGRCESLGWRVRKDGSRFWASVVIDAIRDEGGRLIAFVKVTRDITDQRQAQEELERARIALAQSQKMEAVGQLTGGVAHDFNNLLTVIANSLELLSRPLPDDVQRRRIIDGAQRAAKRGARLTQQLLAFARRQPLRPEVHNVNRLIGGFEAVLRRACPEPIAFETALSAAPVAANIDAPQFEAALLNLVLNARDAMPQGGSLRIATGREAIDASRARTMSAVAPGDFVTVSVADNGVGMAPDVAARAFEPFFTTKEVGKGSGLGLSQVYGFVMQSGGHVAIAGAPGRGTTVTLYLPAAEPPERAASAWRPTGRSVASGRVLVVEDDPDVLDITAERLRLMGYEVLTAPDGPSALAVLRRDAEIDILFSDIVMPRGMNGVELARAALRVRPQLRVLLASGYPVAAPAAGGGEFAFLSKPYRGTELAAALRGLQQEV
jgi:PAS domain S-box-containing protein